MNGNLSGKKWAGASVIRPQRGKLAAKRTGQVVVIILLGMTLLVGLIFFVYNLGAQVNTRLEMQNTADSSVIGGATHFSRSMNVVAMNNVGQVKLMSLVAPLDSLPLSVEISLDEAKQMELGLAAQVASLPAADATLMPDYIRTEVLSGLEALRTRYATQRDILDSMDNAISRSGFDMRSITCWVAPSVGGSPPHGALWRGVRTLEQLSQATVSGAGVRSQWNAVRFAREDRSSASFLTPLMPSIPCRDKHSTNPTTFADYQPPLQGIERVSSTGLNQYAASGGMGGAIPDVQYPHRLGPWARLMRWRVPDTVFVQTGTVHVPAQDGVEVTQLSPSPGGGRSGTSGATRSSGHGAYDRPVGYYVTIGYITYGPYWWTLYDHAGDWQYQANGNLVWYGYRYLLDTHFKEKIVEISNIKMGYMFGPKTVKSVHYPQWHTNYNEAKLLGENPGIQKTMTIYYRVDCVYQRAVAEGPANVFTPLEPWQFVRSNASDPVMCDPAGWYDIGNSSNFPGLQHDQVGDFVWRVAPMGDGPTSVIRPRATNSTPEPIKQERIVSYLIFGGLDTGGTVDISDPCNWSSNEDLPAPVLLDTTDGDYDPLDPDHDAGVRRDKFSFLGSVRKSQPAPYWGTYFRGVNPLDSMVTVAQAEVFNNTSWDLWTQDWRAQLVPVTKWDDWISRMEAGSGAISSLEGSVSSQEYQNILEYLRRLDKSMADLYKHQ